MADIVIFGAGAIAMVAKSYVDAHGPHRVVGFTVDASYCKSETFEGLPLVPWEKLEQYFSPRRVELLGPLSYRRLNEFRRDRYFEGKRRGYRFASFVHPNASVYASEIGENAFILEQNVLQPFVKVGSSVMLWSGNHIGHHTVIEDFCFLASHVTIGSNVVIGEGSFIGGRAAVEGGCTLGPACFIGSTSYVAHNLVAESVVLAVPDPLKPFGSGRLKRHL